MRGLLFFAIAIMAARVSFALRTFSSQCLFENNTKLLLIDDRQDQPGARAQCAEFNGDLSRIAEDSEYYILAEEFIGEKISSLFDTLDPVDISGFINLWIDDPEEADCSR